MRRIEEKPGKKAMRLHWEKQACPRRRNTVAAKAVLSRRQAERGGKDCWDAEQLDRDLASRWSTRVASQPLFPREARVRSLRGKGSRPLCVGKLGWGAAGSPRCVGVARAACRRAGALSGSNPAKPQRRGTNRERMQQPTPPTRLRGCFPVPLTLQALWAAATIEYSGAVEHAQTAIGKALLLGWTQRLASRAGQRPVALVGEVLPRETTRFPGQGARSASHSPAQAPAKLGSL